MGKALGRYLRETTDTPAEPQAPAPRRWQCVCNGCPVTAGIDAGGGDVICRFHHGAAASDWQEITQRLRAREWMVRIADYCAAGDVKPSWVKRADAAAESFGRPELAPDRARRMPSGVIRDETQNPILYAQRINSVLAHECGVKREAPALFPLQKRATTEAVSVADALGL